MSDTTNHLHEATDSDAAAARGRQLGELANRLDPDVREIVLALVHLIELQGEQIDLVHEAVKDVHRLDDLTNARVKLLESQLAALLTVLEIGTHSTRAGGDLG